jgi:hypothetical protein
VNNKARSLCAKKSNILKVQDFNSNKKHHHTPPLS